MLEKPSQFFFEKLSKPRKSFWLILGGLTEEFLEEMSEEIIAKCYDKILKKTHE